MNAESGWVATAVGTAVGTLGWVVGLGKVLWPEHPQWALFFITIGVTIVSMVILDRNDRHSTDRAQT
jgi:hypothetical protein